MPKKTADPVTVSVKGRKYDINKDFTWRELMTVEELSGLPLGRDGSLDTMAVGAAFIYIVLRREDETLTWESFLDGSVSDVASDGSAANGNGDGAPAARRPTRAAKTA